MKQPTLLFMVLITMLMTACSTVSSTFQPVTQTDLPAGQIDTINHAPVILRVTGRTESKNGGFIIYKDITFIDTDGDATTIVDNLVSSNVATSASNVEILASPDEQKSGATVTDTWGCYPNSKFVVETSILDQAGNLSKPETITVSCPVTQPAKIMSFLVIGLVLGLGLLVGAWLLFRHHPFERLPALQSTLLLFCLLFPLHFMYLILHEGGHALVNLTHEKGILFYVHPFSFNGYVMPVFDWNSVWFHFGGAALVIPVSLFIFILLWKHRSLSTLPFVLLFPWAAIMQGIRILSVTGDFHNIKLITGLPAIVFNVPGFLIVGSGILGFVSLLPLLGLAPQDKKSLFVLPASVFLWSVVGGVTAYLVVPGSTIAVQYYLAGEILKSTTLFPINGMIAGVLLAVIYITLYRRVYPKLPAGLRTEAVALTWRDLRLPGLLCVISVILGLMVIT